MGAEDRGAGLISSAAGVLVFLIFLMFAVQLLFGLYASSTITAVTNDAVARAATPNAPSRQVIEAEARANLGQVGDAARFSWSTDDDDGDGEMDTVVLKVVATPPRLVPTSVGSTAGFGEIRRTARARIEEAPR